MTQRHAQGVKVTPTALRQLADKVLNSSVTVRGLHCTQIWIAKQFKWKHAPINVKGVSMTSNINQKPSHQNGINHVKQTIHGYQYVSPLMNVFWVWGSNGSC